MGFWKTFAACLLAIVASSIVSFFLSIMILVSIIAAIGSSSNIETTKIESHSILYIDMAEPIVETTVANPLDAIDFSTMKITRQISSYDVVKMIENAAIEPSIEGIYIKFPLSPAASPTALYEIREALQQFRQESPDKFIVTYAEGYTQGALYLSSVATGIYLNPAGGVQWNGLAMNPMFFKGTLEKLGVTPEIIRNGKFKGAIEPYMLEKMSEENRLQLTSIVNSTWNYILGEIASARSLDTTKLNDAANNLSILTASDAVTFGLVDSVLYADEVVSRLKSLSGIDQDDDCKLISLQKYRNRGGLGTKNYSNKNQIEVIYATGQIVDQSDNSSDIVGEDLAAKIAKARKDDDVKAVVLRVDSPGGSALASDLIWREMDLTRQVKPVIVSMGTYAASGGYWISAPATKIVSSPMTITGSIGVFGIMFNAEKGLKEHLGITADVVKSNQSSDMGVMFRALTPLERHFIQNGVDTIYQQFLTKVSAGRSIDRQRVDSIGQGRVWTGLQAKELGLVDEIGTLPDAILLAAQEAEIENNYHVYVRQNGETSFFDLFMDLSSTAAAKIFGMTADPATKAFEKLKQEHGAIQAIYPFSLTIE